MRVSSMDVSMECKNAGKVPITYVANYFFLLCSINFNLKPYSFPHIAPKRLQAQHSSTRHVAHMHLYACKNDFTDYK